MVIFLVWFWSIHQVQLRKKQIIFVFILEEGQSSDLETAAAQPRCSGQFEPGGISGWEE